MTPQHKYKGGWPLALVIAAGAMSLGGVGAMGYSLVLNHRVDSAIEEATAPLPTPEAEADASAGNDGENQEDQRNGRENRGRRGGRNGGANLPEDWEQRLEQHAVFGAEPQQQPQLMAILGGSALINGQWVAEGESQGPFEVISIGTYDVELVFDGTTRTLTLWNELSGAGGRGRGGRGPARGAPPSRGDRGGDDNNQPSEARGEESPAQRNGPPMRGGFRGGGPSPEQMERLRERMEEMPPEVQARIRERMEQFQNR